MLSSSSHIAVRTAAQSDANGLADIFARSWRGAYTGIIPHLHLDLMIARRNHKWWQRAVRAGESEGISVLEVSGKLAGYASYGAARRRGWGEGEIYELYLDPVYQGLGFGELLFEACCHDLDARHLRGLLVWSLADNDAAMEFYWRRGGRPVALTTDRFGLTKLEKVAFGWG